MKGALTSSLFLLIVSVNAANDFVVGVGKDENTGKKGTGFDPSVIVPQAGDRIVFEFRSGAHSVLQSSFENPCATKEGGWDSGVQSVSDSFDVDAPGLPTINLIVNDTQPIWFFDQAGGKCQEGAVLAVNPSSTQSAAQFKENASKSSSSSSSSSSSASSGGSSSSGTSTSGTASQTSPGSSNSASPSASDKPNSAARFGVGVGVGAGALVLLGFFAL